MRILLVLSLAALSAAKQFHGDQVVTVFPTNWDQVAALQKLADVPGLVDFWSPQYADELKPNSPADIRFPSEHLVNLKEALGAKNIDYQVKIDELQSLLDDQIKGRMQQSKIGAYNYDVYHTYDEINDWTKDIAATYSDKITRTLLGYTYEGRDIPLLKISTNDNNPIFLMDCGFHAREWISHAFCQCFVRNLMEEYNTDPDIKAAVDGLTIYIVPVLNGDGYDFSWTSDRMWRKTRSNYNTVCYGVDPNRNFDAGWATGDGSSDQPCAETYHGPSVESEVEVQALSDFIRTHNTIKTYVTVHSYSQMIVYPYAYKTDPAPNKAQLNQYAAAAAEAVKNPYNTRYTYGQTTDILYPAPGGSDDFALDNGATLSYTAELRDRGRYGFALPENQIAPTCVETTNMMKVFMNAARQV